MKLSFQTKLIISLAIIITIIFGLMGLFMANARSKELRSEIVNNAQNFVLLSTDKIGDAFLRYYKNAFFKFRSIIISNRNLNRDLKNIQIVDLKGRIYYDMNQYEKGLVFLPALKYTDDDFVLANLKKMEMKIQTNDRVCIIAPYIDEYGVHNYSIVYYFTLERLKKELKDVVVGSAVMAAVTILLGIILAYALAQRITGHLKVLSEGAKRIAQGDFSPITEIRTGDEFEDLAWAFNFMSEKIRENIRELNNLVAELKRRDAQKTQLLANISHELRTPLTASLGYVDYLAKGKMGDLNEDQKHSLEVIRRNLERLNKEIHSLLLISKYTLEGVQLNPEKFDIGELITIVIHDFTPEMRRKELSFAETLEVREIYADKNGIRTVLENLINNGIKFAYPKSMIKIQTRRVEEGDNEMFQFEISNQGPTIPQDQLEKIFEPFHQVDTDASRKYGGIGLGLSIARNIIEAHEGKIWAESKDGVNKFFFSLPQRRVQ